MHTATAELFGIAEGTLASLLSDLDSAPVDGRLKPLLRYVGKLTLTPSRMTPSDVQAVYDAGFDEKALHDAVSVAALFNLMNRLVEGLGVTADDSYFPKSAQRLADIGYRGLKQLLKPQP